MFIFGIAVNCLLFLAADCFVAPLTSNYADKVNGLFY